MTETRKHNPCTHCVDGVCDRSLTEHRPTKSQEAVVSPPWLIENPGLTIQGLLCTVAGDSQAQAECDTFTEGDGTDFEY